MDKTIEVFPPEWQVIPNKSLVGQTWEHVKWILSAMWWNESEMADVDRIVREIMNGARTDCVQAILDIENIPEQKHWNGWHWLMW